MTGRKSVITKQRNYSQFKADMYVVGDSFQSGNKLGNNLTFKYE